MRLTTLIRTRLEHVRNERRTRAQIEARQLKKFRRLVAHVARRSPYYQDIIREHRIDVDRCVPQDFPVLTRTDVMVNLDRIVTDRTITRERIADFVARPKGRLELFAGKYHVVNSSGSSGEQGYFVYSNRDWTKGVTAALRANPPGFYRRRLAFFGTTQGRPAGATLALCTQRSLTRWFYELGMYEMNAPLAATLAGLNAFQPNILMSYPSGLSILARRQLEGSLSIHPQYVQCSGEVAQPGDRQVIERAFGVPLLNTYSCSEHLLMGLHLPEYGGMYLFEDDLIFELEADHTLVTNLFNYTMPLIRYRMNDTLTRQEDRVGRLPFMKVDMVGRSEEMPIFVNERGEDDFIAPAALRSFLLMIKDAQRIQLELAGPAACVLRICLPSDGVGPQQRGQAQREAHARFGELLAQKEMRNVRYRVEVVDDLPVDPKTGKFRMVVPANDDPGGKAMDVRH